MKENCYCDECSMFLECRDQPWNTHNECFYGYDVEGDVIV